MTDHRPGPRQRGYDAAHDAERRRWQPLVTIGAVGCWRCQGQDGPLDPDDWHLGHDDEDRTRYRGPEHPRCNTSAGARQSHQHRPARRRPTEPHPGGTP